MAIHQEVRINASPKTVYNVLTNSEKFAKMTGGRTAAISPDEGGEVSLFGGDIRARNVELVPGKRVVQAWRSSRWPEGVYSIVRFELDRDGDGTKLVFDQSGYPDGAHDMLDSGWGKMYWEPMKAMLAADDCRCARVKPLR
jgi:activator of HSP90 ATPase